MEDFFSFLTNGPEVSSTGCATLGFKEAAPALVLTCTFQPVERRKGE